MCDGPDAFFIYASGNTVFDQCVITINTLHRSEIFCYLYNLFQGEQETVTIDLRLNEKFKRDMVFAVGPKRKEASLKAKFFELVRLHINM